MKAVLCDILELQRKREHFLLDFSSGRHPVNSLVVIYAVYVLIKKSLCCIQHPRILLASLIFTELLPVQ